jgi:hypothetical protein
MIAAARVARADAELLAAVLGKAPIALAGGAGWLALNLVAQGRAPLGAAAASLGILQAVRGVGTGVGPALASRALGRGAREPRLGRAANALALAGMGAVVALGHPAALLAAALVWGLGSGTNWVLTSASLQRRAPDAFIGRLAALDDLATVAAQTLGVVAAAALVAASGELAAVHAILAAGALAWLGLAYATRSPARQIARVLETPHG